MKAIRRQYNQILTERLLEPRHFMQVLVGPRQVGKTTLVRQILDQEQINGTYITADNTSNVDGKWLEIQWQNARQSLQFSETGKFVLIIDEIQKVSNWSETVKYLWDYDTQNGMQLHVVLLGSSRLLVQEGLTESLAGRFERIYIPHWTYAEMKEAYGVTLQEYIWFGGYPGAHFLQANEERWKNYVLNALIETAISKDILMLQRIDKPALLRRTFEVAAAYSGQIVAYNKILGNLEAAGNSTTLAGYIQLLDSAGLVCGLQKFAANKVKMRGSIPKFLVQNTALFSAYSPLNLEQATVDRTLWGRVVESAVGAHLYNASIDGRFSLSYWREGVQEVDFVLQKGEQIVCVEVKSSIGNGAINHSNFVKKYPQAKSIMVGGNGLLLETFLSHHPSTLF